MGREQVLVLNLEDEARENGVQVDCMMLERLLGIPVISATAVLGKGVGNLIRRLHEARVARLTPSYPAMLDRAARQVAARVTDAVGNARQTFQSTGNASEKSVVPFVMKATSKEGLIEAAEIPFQGGFSGLAWDGQLL